MTQKISTTNKANSASETMICAPWVVFASRQGQRGEYQTMASAAISATTEEEICALCREFHNALGIQEVPEGVPVFLFWKARESSHRIVTQVLRASAPGQRIAYEYFSVVLTPADLQKLENNPLRALEQIGIKELRQRYTSGSTKPVYFTVTANRKVVSSSPFQNGTRPASQENSRALLDFIQSGGAAQRTFAMWWPSARPPRAGAFDIVLRSDEARVARPQEILAIATELNRSLSRRLLAPPSYDSAGTRIYRVLLQSADEVQTMLNEAYFPAALEESPPRWMTRPQKVAGLCLKIADDLPDYASRLPVHLSDEIAAQCSEWSVRYEDLARALQKLRHPNVLHQSQTVSGTGIPKKSVTPPNITPQRPITRPKAQPNSNPWAEEQASCPNADTFRTQLGGAKSGYALESTASKFGSIFALLLISSVAAVGVFLSDEKPILPLENSSAQSAPVPRDAQKRVYDLAYQLAKQRVKTASGLTRQQRLQAAREALAQIMGGNVSRLDAAAILKLAKQAPENVKHAAFRGVQHGEAKGIREQS